MLEVSGSNLRLGGLGVSPLQASGGIGTLQSRASGLQSTTQGNSIRTNKQQQQQQQQHHRVLRPGAGSWLPRARLRCVQYRHPLNRHLVRRYLVFLLQAVCLYCEVLKGMFPWRTRYPVSQDPSGRISLGVAYILKDFSPYETRC